MAEIEVTADTSSLDETLKQVEVQLNKCAAAARVLSKEMDDAAELLDSLPPGVRDYITKAFETAVEGATDEVV